MPPVDRTHTTAASRSCPASPNPSIRARRCRQRSMARGVPTTRARPQARARDRIGGLAARGGGPLPAGIPVRSPALGRMPDRQSLQDQTAERADRRVRVSAVVLLEPVGRYPWAVLRVLRPAGDPLDAVESAQHLRLAPRQRRAAGFVRAGEVVGGDASESAGTSPIAPGTRTVF